MGVLGALALGLALAVAMPAAHGAPAITLGVVPQFPALEVHRTWTPLANALSATLGRPVELRMYPSIPAFEEEVLAGRPDLAYLNPYHMVMARDAAGYVPLVRDGAQRLSGIVVVRADSPIRSLRELEGSTLVFPAPNAFGASLLIRALLAGQQRVAFTASYVKTHSNAYRYVARGEVAAAGGIRATFEREPQELRERLRVLYETPGFAAHPLAAHPRVPAEARAAVLRALRTLRDSEQGRAQLAAVLIADPVAADYERDYGEIARLGLGRYVVRGDGA